jgi:hypothetical protein
MSDPTAISLLQQCVHEIRSLRRQINDLSPKAEAYEVVCAALLGPRPSKGYGVDLAFTVEARIAEMKDGKAETSPSVPAPE